MTTAAEIIRRAAASQDPEATLRQAGWKLTPPEPPPSPPTAESFYRHNIADIARTRHAWTGGSNPEPLLTAEERNACQTRADASHAYHLARIAGAATK